ncbi:MAG TPA: hypothetical protein PLP17_08430, partial [Oligoflexia bacterium]|nr:hypothetical protein [Oligoflexia bacterium]
MVIGLEFTGHIAQSIFDETVSLVLAEIYMALSLTVGAVVQPLTLNAFEYTGGVANTVSAYLQTKGLIDQGKILADFEKLRWIAALAWLFAVSLAVGSIAVFGNYRQGLYLLIGPPLFYYMTTTTLETDGTQLRFGDRVVPGAPAEQKQMLTWIRTIGGEMDPDTGEITGAGTAKVSFFFGVFDTMVTEAVHKLVTLAVNTAKADDLRFVARERILNYLLHSTPIDEGFTKLLGTAYYGECSNIQDDIQRTFTLEKKAWIKLRPIEDLKKSDEHRKKVDAQKQVDPGYSEKAFLLAMKKEGVPEISDVPDWQSAAAHGPSVSCEQLWKWVGGACKRLAADKIKAESLRDVAGEKMTEEYWLKAWNDAVAWLARTMAPVGGAQTEDEKARDALATYILKNGMQKSSIDALTTGVFSRSPFNSREYDTIAGPLARAEAHGGYFRLKYFAYSVPYIQGLLLYLLCIAFPFFSVFLVLPGKAPAFFVWCSLWVWVKSWDVGFALIHVFRDIMWHMLGERA